MSSKLTGFFRREPVLSIAALAAIVTAFFASFSLKAIGEAIDWRVLALLFCLMAVVQGLEGAGLFEKLAQSAIQRAGSLRGLCAVLVLLCFFSSMLVTNDVALLTFVPFAVLVLRGAGFEKHLLYVVVLQTAAANLGSMATPVGNPQNLFLFSRYQMSAPHFFIRVLPVAGLSLLLLLLLLLPIPRGSLSVQSGQSPRPLSLKAILPYGILFALCLCTVLHLVPYPITFVLVLLYLAVKDRPILRRVDYGLLLTFVFFFLFVGNLGAIPPVKQALYQAIQGREMIACTLMSQVISNVPAAVLLSGFTEKGGALLLGSNLGGLGTLVASLASLISFRLYGKAQPEQKGRYLLYFTLVNVLLLLLLLPLCLLLDR